MGRQKPTPDQVFVTPVGIGQLERGGPSVRPRGVSRGELIDFAPLPEGGYLQDRAGSRHSGSEAGGNWPSRGSFIPSTRVEHSGGTRKRERESRPAKRQHRETERSPAPDRDKSRGSVSRRPSVSSDRRRRQKYPDRYPSVGSRQPSKPWKLRPRKQ